MIMIFIILYSYIEERKGRVIGEQSGGVAAGSRRLSRLS